MRPYRRLIKLGRWELGVWFSRMFWTWTPRSSAAWSGQLAFYNWLCFEVLRDDRGHVLNAWKHRG